MESTAAAAKAKAKLRANKKEEKDKNQKGKIAKGKGKEVVLNYAKFEGQGLNFKAKLFGFVEVPGPRGDESSIQAIQKLKQQAKQLKKGANEHKLKITFNITLQGVRLFNEKTQTIEHEHPIHKISFISHDPEDRHVFGYIYSPPRSAPNEARKYYLFAIKSDKSADAITVQLYELFQVVYRMQESRKARSKDNSAVKPKQQDESSQPLEPLQDKMLLEMSNKIGGEQQQSTADEHLYAEPAFVKLAAPDSTSDAELTIPSDQPVQASSNSESNECKVPHPQNDMSESADVTAGVALSSSTSESETSHPLSDSVSTPTSNGDSRFEAAFDSTLSFPTGEVSNENTFHANFSSFENGFATSENKKSYQDLPEAPNDSENKDVPISNEASPSNQIPVGDSPMTADVTTEFETSQNESASVENEISLGPAETVRSTEGEDMNINSTQFQSEENLKDSSIPPTVNFSSFESEAQNDSNVNDVGTENTGAAKSNKFISQVSSFEVHFDTEEDDRTLEQNEQNKLAFEPTSDPFTDQNAFSAQDPFASTSPTEFDQAAFGTFPDDDPFSPKGGSNIGTKSDPFVDKNDPFTTGFTVEESGENNSDQQNDQQSESSSREDVFEAIFEAKMEGEFEVENFDKDKKELPDNTENTVEFKSYGEEDKIADSQEKEVIEILQKDENINPTEAVEGLNESPDKENLNELQQEKAERDENEKEKLNAFDFSSSDVYVTLKTAASASNRPLSPTEFSPPPLPPRSVISMESLETITSPKIPPALPPRPPVHLSETALRKPPELPPRVDLEEKNAMDNEMLRSAQENNSETFGDAASPTFQTNFDSFDFSSMENNTPVIGSPAFDSNDPFKDPFAGADPFQTPVAGDPFASPVSFERDSQPVKDNIDPFSGDDPFAMTPVFDAEASFKSSFNSNSPEPNNEAGNDAEKDKFADFSSAFS